MPGLLACPRCQAPCPPERHGAPGLFPCGSCGARLQLFPFPALVRSAAEAAGGAAAAEGEASCFFHPHKRAVHACRECGRFVCDLCDVPLGDGHLCPDCLTAGGRKGTVASLVGRRILHDRVALGLAVLPVLFVFPTAVTAPAALAYALVNWNSPGSLLPHTRGRLVTAILLALAQIAVWVFVLAKALS